MIKTSKKTQDDHDERKESYTYDNFFYINSIYFLSDINDANILGFEYFTKISRSYII